MNLLLILGILSLSQASASSPPKPSLDHGPDQHVVLNQDFNLTCSLQDVNDVDFNWTLPNPHAERNNITKSVMDKGGRKDKLSTLHVLNATKEDEGNYTCRVEIPGNEITESDPVYIYIEESPYYIHITSAQDVLDYKDRKTLTWTCDIHAYPTDVTIRYTDNMGDEIHNNGDDRRKITISNSQSSLKISRLSSSDFGEYTIKGSFENDNISISDSKTVLVRVRSKVRRLKMTDVPLTVAKGDILRVSCTAVGYPLPNTTWCFRNKTCTSEPNSNCCNGSTEIEPQDVEDEYPPPHNIKKQTISFEVQDTGILCCTHRNMYENKLKWASYCRDICISDIGEPFVLRHKGRQGITTILTQQSSTEMESIDLVENDAFQLECSITKCSYTDVKLMFNGSEIETQENNTEFSVQKSLPQKNVTIDMQGLYSCQAEGSNSNIIRELQVRVTAEEAPYFTNDANMNNSIVTNVSELVLNCTVVGSPRPTIKWFKDEENLTSKSPLFDRGAMAFSNDFQRLEIKHVSKAHCGTYCCEAENRLNLLRGCQTIKDEVNEDDELGVREYGLGTTGTGIITVACVCVALFLILAIVVIVFGKRIKKERKFRRSFRQTALYLFEKGNTGDLNPDCTADEQAELLPYDKSWEVSRNKIKLGKQLGSGAFGRVVKAVAQLRDSEHPTTVAVKMCRNQADQAQVRALALELKIMIHLGQHLNIVNLMGANTLEIGKGELWILVEFCRYGNLLSFMHRQRKLFVNQIDPFTGQIDHEKQVRDSPVDSDMRENHSNRTDQHGYLAPVEIDFFSGVTPHSVLPANTTGSSDGSFVPKRTTERSHSHSTANQQFSVSFSPSSSSGSGRYGQDSMTVVNTDMTYSSDPRKSLLLSRKGSNPASEFGLDSQGSSSRQTMGSIPGGTSPFTTTDLILWSWQVAQGMDYLTRRKVLHGDLAARNLLLADNNVVKISDFGLSRDVYKKDVYMKKGDDLMPIKWMSVEAIRDRIFSIQSDVWAYGVTLWELFTLGAVPYGGIEVNEDFFKLIEEGHRMEMPKYANEKVYDLMLHCWQNEPTDRPSFSKAAEYLEILLRRNLQRQYKSLNDPYLLLNEKRFATGTDFLSQLASPDFNNFNRTDYLMMQDMNNEDAIDGEKGEGYLSMTSPDCVRYSQRHHETGNGTSELNYLLIDPGEEPSPGPSLSPNETTRFTFEEPGGENMPRVTELKEVDETKEEGELVAENTSLLNSELSNAH